MDASIIAGIISAAAGTANAIGGSYLQAGMNRRQMRYARKLANQGLTNSDLQAFQLNQQAAQDTRDFALQMDSTNYQRKVADMQAAGVNPALAIGGVQAAPSSNATASAQNTGNVSPIGVNGPDLGSVAQFATLPFEIRNMKEQNKLIAEEAKSKEIENKIKSEELKITPQKFKLMIDSMQATIDKDSAQARQFQAQKDFIDKQASRYDDLTDADIALKYSQVGLNDAEAEVARKTYEKINVECSWLPKMYAAQIANNMAAAGFTNKQASMLKFSLIKTVTLGTAKSMGINILGKFGINGSSSNDTLVMICPTDNGSWECIGLSSSDIKDRQSSNNPSSDDVQDLINGD